MAHDFPVPPASRARAQQVVGGFFAALFVLGFVTLSGCSGTGASGFHRLSSLQITPTNPSVAAGTSAQFTATGIYTDSSHVDLTDQVSWATSNAAVATVDASTGKAQGVMAGTAILSANLQGLTAATTLTVTRATLVSIAITPPMPSIAVGTSEQFSATGTFSDNTTQDLTADLTWTSSNSLIATVSGSGQAKSVGPGNATITATCRVASTCGSLAGTATLVVTSATLVSIALTPANPSIALGTSETFAATGTYSDNSTQPLTAEVTWSSATPAIATISNATGSPGVANAVTTGTTRVTAVLGNVTSAAVTLTVTPATLASIAITPSAPSIALGTNQAFTAIGTYSDHSTQDLTTQVTWMSATPAVATLSNASGTAGMATSITTGSTLVTAMLGSVTSPAVTLAVTPATLMSIAVTPTGPSIPVAGTKQFIATGTYSDSSSQVLTNAVTWVSSDTSIAPISNAVGSQGLGTGLLVGSTSITAALNGVNSPATPLTVMAQVESVLYSFTGGNDGANPYAILTQGADGSFYGMTFRGGTSNNGTLFKITPAGVETVLYSFAGGNDGANPYGGLIQGADGSFYGTTYSGGTSSEGTVFKITPAGIEAVLYSFTGGNDGGNPAAALIQGADGSFYGTTLSGGLSNVGTVFKITPTGIETVLYSFTGGNDGADPQAELIQDADGNFYGTTGYGGPSNAGTIFKVTPAGIETVLYSFTSGNDGTNPYGGLIQGADGSFYGTTYLGGTSSEGTVFRITPAGIGTVLYSFTGGNDGVNPQVTLIQAADGNFYGTTGYGGLSNAGTIFKITPAGIETVLYSFAGGNDGASPAAGLIQDADGNFYGMTLYGGPSNMGTVFKF